MGLNSIILPKLISVLEQGLSNGFFHSAVLNYLVSDAIFPLLIGLNDYERIKI